MIPVNKRKIGICILLSIVTFGIYQIYWMYLLVKNTRAIQKDFSSCTGEMLCLMFVPFYSLFWWFTRGKIVKDKFAEHGHSAIGNEIAYSIFSIFGLAIVSMAIMQNDFNSLRSDSIQSIQRSTVNFLKVTGILMIIGGAIRMIAMIIVLIKISVVVDLIDGIATALTGKFGLIYASCIIGLLGSIVEFVAGIIGVAYSKKPEKANTCFVWGIIVVVFTVIGTVLSLIGGSSFGSQIVYLLTGLVVPVLYIIGANLNKKAQQ